jgi:hypothetical protein
MDDQMVAHGPHAARDVIYAARGKVSGMLLICTLGRVLSKWAELSDSHSKCSVIIAYASLQF